MWFRLWKSATISKAKSMLGDVQYEANTALSSVPSIILSSFNQLSDFLILSYLFKDQDLTFLATRTVPKSKISSWLCSVNHVLYVDDYEMGYPLFREILEILRDFNRSIVISPEAAKQYASNFPVNPAVIAKIAMIANAPIIPVRFNRSKLQNKCDAWIGKRIYISPRADEFKDIFFKQRKFRKFSNLPPEDLSEIGERIFAKLKNPKGVNGSNLS